MRMAWGCVYTNPGCEGLARDDVARRPAVASVMLPMLALPDQPTQPMFPRYMFARLDLDAAWQQVRYAKGVARLLGGETCPSIIPDAVMDELALRLGPADTFTVERAPRRDVRVDDMVKITINPTSTQGCEWRDWEGMVTKAGKHRVTVMLDVFGRRREYNFDRASVEAIG